jgi:hypothetical protein
VHRSITIRGASSTDGSPKLARQSGPDHDLLVVEAPKLTEHYAEKSHVGRYRRLGSLMNQLAHAGRGIVACHGHCLAIKRRSKGGKAIKLRDETALQEGCTASKHLTSPPLGRKTSWAGK